jgi:hypothetical protein
MDQIKYYKDDNPNQIGLQTQSPWKSQTGLFVCLFFNRQAVKIQMKIQGTKNI